MASAFGFNYSGSAGASVGMNAAQGVAQFIIASGQRDLAQANADARNIVRAGQNEQRIAESKLSAVIRGINNRRRLESMADGADAVLNTALRAQEAFTQGQFEQGLRLSEVLGAASAQAGAAGMGGSSVDAIGDATQGRAARLQQAQEEAQGDQQYDLYKQRAGVIEQGIQSLDMTPITANLDYGRDLGPAGSPFGDLVGNLVGNLIGTKEQRDTLNTFMGSISKQTVPAGTSQYSLAGSPGLGLQAGGGFFGPEIGSPSIRLK